MSLTWGFFHAASRRVKAEFGGYEIALLSGWQPYGLTQPRVLTIGIGKSEWPANCRLLDDDKTDDCNSKVIADNDLIVTLSRVSRGLKS